MRMMTIRGLQWRSMQQRTSTCPMMPPDLSLRVFQGSRKLNQILNIET